MMPHAAGCRSKEIILLVDGGGAWMGSNVLRLVPALSQHHTGNADNIDRYMADMG